MVNRTEQNNAENLGNQHNLQSVSQSAKIGPDTRYEFCGSSMTAFGGLLGLVKFLDLVKFKDVFEKHYCSPSRKPKLGCYLSSNFEKTLSGD